MQKIEQIFIIVLIALYNALGMTFFLEYYFNYQLCCFCFLERNLLIIAIVLLSMAVLMRELRRKIMVWLFLTSCFINILVCAYQFSVQIGLLSSPCKLNQILTDANSCMRFSHCFYGIPCSAILIVFLCFLMTYVKSSFSQNSYKED